MLSERTLALSISSMELEGRLGLRELCSFAREIRELKLSELRPSLSFAKMWPFYCLFILLNFLEGLKWIFPYNYIVVFFCIIFTKIRTMKKIIYQRINLVTKTARTRNHGVHFIKMSEGRQTEKRRDKDIDRLICCHERWVIYSQSRAAYAAVTFKTSIISCNRVSFIGKIW